MKHIKEDIYMNEAKALIIQPNPSDLTGGVFHTKAITFEKLSVRARGKTLRALALQADGSLVVGTSTQEAPVWRVEQDGSSVSTLPSGNITIPVVSIAASPSTLYITDYHAMLQLPVETESTYWREVPSMQGMRSAPIVAN